LGDKGETRLGDAAAAFGDTRLGEDAAAFGDTAFGDTRLGEDAAADPLSLDLLLPDERPPLYILKRVTLFLCFFIPILLVLIYTLNIYNTYKILYYKLYHRIASHIRISHHYGNNPKNIYHLYRSIMVTNPREMGRADAE
jgi:hypothetical protein